MATFWIPAFAGKTQLLRFCEMAHLVALFFHNLSEYTEGSMVMDEILRDLCNPNNDGTNLARRLAAALAAFAAVLLLFSFLSCGATIVFVAWTARFGLTEGSRVAAASVMTLLSLGVPVFLYTILRRWIAAAICRMRSASRSTSNLTERLWSLS
jgi:hypothetical protein